LWLSVFGLFWHCLEQRVKLVKLAKLEHFNWPAPLKETYLEFK
jgi:hypothetical protein